MTVDKPRFSLSPVPDYPSISHEIASDHINIYFLYLLTSFTFQPYFISLKLWY